MTHLVDIRQHPPLPNNSCELVNEVALATVMGAMYGLSSTKSLCPSRLTWLKLLLSAQSASSRGSSEPNVAPLLQGLSQPPGLRLITLNHFHYGRGSKLLLLELPLALDIGFTAHKASAKTAICGFLERLFHHRGIHSKWNTVVDSCSWIHWSFLIPHHLEATPLTDDWLNGFLKIQLYCPVGGDTRQDWGSVHQFVVNALNQHSLIPYPGLRSSGIKG